MGSFQGDIPLYLRDSSRMGTIRPLMGDDSWAAPHGRPFMGEPRYERGLLLGDSLFCLRCGLKVFQIVFAAWNALRPQPKWGIK